MREEQNAAEDDKAKRYECGPVLIVDREDLPRSLRRPHDAVVPDWAHGQHVLNIWTISSPDYRRTSVLIGEHPAATACLP